MRISGASGKATYLSYITCSPHHAGTGHISTHIEAYTLLRICPRLPEDAQQRTLKSTTAKLQAATKTTGEFRYFDPATFPRSDVPFVKPWAKVDIDATSFARTPHRRSVTDIRGAPGPFGTVFCGFLVFFVFCREATDFDDHR